MGQAIADNDDRLLWDEVKKITRSNCKLPSTIDGQNEPADITNIFSDKYKSLYNSVGYKTTEMRRLNETIK